MRSFDEIRADYGLALELDPNRGGAAQPDPRNRRFVQRAVDQIVRWQRKPARRAAGRTARRSRAVNRGR